MQFKQVKHSLTTKSIIDMSFFSDLLLSILGGVITHPIMHPNPIARLAQPNEKRPILTMILKELENFILTRQAIMIALQPGLENHMKMNLFLRLG